MTENALADVPKKNVLPYCFRRYRVALGLEMPYLPLALGDSTGVGSRSESRGITPRWHSGAGSSCGVVNSPRPFSSLTTGLDGVFGNSSNKERSCHA